MKTYIHVNQHKIRSNKKNGSNNPVISVKTYKSNEYVHEVDIEGPAKLVYSPQKALACGATCYIVTDGKVTYSGSQSERSEA